MPPFRLHRPATVDDAVGLLATLGDGARAYAGGTELLLVLREGLLEATDLVDLKRVAGLADIRPVDGGIEIGALATHTQVAESRLVRTHLPAFAAAESALANRRVRNTGTIGGNLCFGEPHGDPAPLLLALDAAVLVRGETGVRRAPLGAWLVGPFEVDLRPGEILAAVWIPVPAGRRALAYHRVRTLERPTVSAAVALGVEPGRDAILAPGVVVGCAGPTPVRITAAEELLGGASVRLAERVVTDLARACGAAAAARTDAVGDVYGPETYKRRLAAVLTRRAVVDAFARLDEHRTATGAVRA